MQECTFGWWLLRLADDCIFNVPGRFTETCDRSCDTMNCLFQPSWNIAVVYVCWWTMLHTSTHIKELGLIRILQAKNEICHKARTTMQCLNVSTLNLNATHYINLINWKECKVTVPPILLRHDSRTTSRFCLLIIARWSWIFKVVHVTLRVNKICVTLVKEATAAACGAKNSRFD